MCQPEVELEFIKVFFFKTHRSKCVGVWLIERGVLGRRTGYVQNHVPDEGHPSSVVFILVTCVFGGF